MQKQVWVTAYDLISTKSAVAGGADVLLVGDSLGNVIYGFERTDTVTLDLMLPHIACVCQFSQEKRVVADMPIRTYDTPDLALKNAEKIKQAGTNHVKIEGYKPRVTAALLDAKFTVTGHLGLLPQTAKKLTRTAVSKSEQAEIIRQAKHLEALGTSEIVLECVPETFAEAVQKEINIPIIGIGSGKNTHGQVLVWHDIVGFSVSPPPFAKAFSDAKNTCKEAISNFVLSVKNG